MMHIDFNFQSHHKIHEQTNIKYKYKKARLIIIPDYCHWSTWVNTEFHNIYFDAVRATAPCLHSYRLALRFPYFLSLLTLFYSCTLSLFTLIVLDFFYRRIKKKCQSQCKKWTKRRKNTNTWCLTPCLVRHKILIHV